MARKTGRKLKLTRKLIDEAESLVKAGNYYSTVFQYLGIAETTWYRWLDEGKTESSGLKKEFRERIKSAESHGEIRNVQIIQKAASKSWQASAWYLERKFPERWGRKDRLDAEFQHRGEVSTNNPFEGLTTEELKKIAGLEDE